MTSKGLEPARFHRPIASVVTCLTLLACARFEASPLPMGDAPRLQFTNTTPDHVTVYLVVAGTHPLRLGDVDAFRTSTLPLPMLDLHSNARLLAVPVGSRTGRRSLDDPEAGTRSSLGEPMEDILNMRWTLVGHQLFSTPSVPR